MENLLQDSQSNLLEKLYVDKSTWPQLVGIVGMVLGEDMVKMSGCEKTKSRFDGDPIWALDPSYPFLVQPIRQQHVTLVCVPQCLTHQGGLCTIAQYIYFYCLCQMTHLQPTSDSL